MKLTFVTLLLVLCIKHAFGQFENGAFSLYKSIQPELYDSCSFITGLYSGAYHDNQLGKSYYFNDTKLTLRFTTSKNEFLNKHFEFGFNLRSYLSNYSKLNNLIYRSPITIEVERNSNLTSYILTPGLLGVFKSKIFVNEINFALAYQLRYNKGGTDFEFESDSKLGQDILLSLNIWGVGLWGKITTFDYTKGWGRYSNSQGLKYTLPGSIHNASQFGISYEKQLQSQMLKVYLVVNSYSQWQSNWFWSNAFASRRNEIGLLYRANKFTYNIEVLNEPESVSLHTTNVVRRQYHSFLIGYKTSVFNVKPGISFVQEKELSTDHATLNSNAKFYNWMINLVLEVCL